MRKFFPCWLFFHFVILLSFLVSLFFSPKITFSTSLFDILPPSSSLREVQKADSALAEKTSRAVTILVKSDSFESAKSAAEKLYFSYVGSDGNVNPNYFDSLSLYVDSDSVSEMLAWLHENRFFLLDEETRALLEEGNASQIAEDALMTVYGAFSFSDLSTIDEDPFLLSERSLRHFLEDGAVSATSMALRDNVLSCEKDGAFFVLIRGTVSKKGAALASKKSTVRNLYSACEILKEAQNDNLDFIFSGVPFHSYESSTSAQAQISVISTVSLILIVLVFLWIFRSFLPALVSAFAVTFSCGMGFVSTLLFFRGIHVLTFVFGTTLIGTCLDYSIHYFVNWKANPDCDSGSAVRKHIFRGITLGFISTEICFAALFFAPFPLLKQVSVFLFFGLATAYLSVVALYPILPMPSKKESKLASIPNLFTKCRFIPLLLVIFSIIIIGINYRSFRIQNNIQELYSISQNMLQNEITSAQVLDTGSSGWYFILKADSEEALLQKNEELSNFLTKSVDEKKLGTFLSLSQFIPSEKKQAENYHAAEKLLPLAGDQYDALGLAESPLETEKFVTDYINSYRSLENSFIHLNGGHLPSAIREAISNLWIGEIDGSYYSCLLPLHAKGEEEQFFREFAAQTDGVFFVNKVKDISSQLDILSKSMILTLALAFVFVLGILFFCYRPKLVLKIAAIPLIVTLVTTAILILCKIHLSFFPVTALVLVSGLDLDYIIYAIEGSQKTESENSSLNTFAILLSFVTTALSFGALAISTFPPVHMLGLTVFVGLSTAVLSAFCMTKK